MKKKYQIATIANLLLDMEFSVNDDFLASHAIEKGLQTMVDDQQHQQLLQALSGMATQQAAGGACTNSVVAAACLGARTFVNGRVGRDQAGETLIQSLAEGAIQVNASDKLFTEGDTGKCIVLITPDAERTMLTYLGVSSSIPLNTVEIDALLSTEYFLVEGFQCIPDQTRATNIKAITLAKSAGAKIALSICDEAVVEYFHDQIMSFIDAAPIDILFCNQQEAIGLARTTNLEDAIDRLKAIAQKLVITRGPQGAIIWTGEELIDIKGEKAVAQDTTGAGDIFVGVFLWALQSGFTDQQAASLANKAAAKLVTQYGARLSQLELQSIFNTFQHEALQVRETVNVVG